jgi:hypothetical protein
MGLLDFFQKKKISAVKPLQSVLPMTGPLGSSVAINRGIVTWQGADVIVINTAIKQCTA